MKVVIVSPPKSGANRLRCLLATLYALRAIDARDVPAGSSPAASVGWLETLPDDCVTHTDLPFDPTIFASAASLGVTFVAIVRHPFDLFLSNREVRRHRDQRANRRTRARGASEATVTSPQSIDSEYGLDSFAADVQTMLDWSSGMVATVRYDEILEHPESMLARLASGFGRIDEATIAHAVKLCPAEPRIVSSGNRGVRMTEIPPGSWQTRLDAETIDELHRQFHQAVTRLGYESSFLS